MREILVYLKEGISMFFVSVAVATLISGLYTLIFKKNKKPPVGKTDIQNLNEDAYATKD